jgi:hypothetical protein
MKRFFPQLLSAFLLFLDGCSTVGGDMKEGPTSKGSSVSSDTNASIIEVTSVSSFKMMEKSLVVDGNIFDPSGVKKVIVYYMSKDGKMKGQVPATYNTDSFSATVTFPDKGDYYIWVEAVDSSNNLTNKDKILVNVAK